MRFTVWYKVYPDCPQATDLSKTRELIRSYLSLFAGIGSLAVLIFYFVGIFEFYEKLNYATYLRALAMALPTAAVDVYLFGLHGTLTNWKCESYVLKEQFRDIPPAQLVEMLQLHKMSYTNEMKRVALTFSLFTCTGLFGSLSLIGIWYGIRDLVTNNPAKGTPLLFFSVGGTVAIALAVWLINKWIKQKWPAKSQAGSAPSDLAQRLVKGSNAVLIIGVIVFLLLFVRMSPGAEYVSILYYCGVAAVLIVCSVCMYKIMNKRSRVGICIAAILFVVLINVAAGTCYVIYDAKKDVAKHDMPQSGPIYVQLKIDASYCTSDFFPRQILNPYASINIGSEVYHKGDKWKIELGESYPARVNCGYDRNHGHADETITFQSDDFTDQIYTYTTQVSINEEVYAGVRMSFERVLSFWDVVLYTPE